MPVRIEMGCDGLFHVSSDGHVVRVKTLDKVHKAIDHHYHDYRKHDIGKVKGCPFCEEMGRDE